MAQPAGSKGPSKKPGSTAEDAATANSPILRKFGKYEIKRQIGAGGMGAVYLAVDPGLKRSVALKILPREKAANPILVKRFKAEAQAAANLRHDNIVMVYEAGDVDGLLYIALEYVDGTDVSNIVQQRGLMPVKRTIEIVRQMGLALQHAHSQGIVHRDIKPANIIVRRDGVAKLADLGLARAVDDHSDTAITRAGTTVGTIDYMPPEQARDSKSADVRSDIYSLGCTWYFMLTGEPPFPSGSMTNKLRCHAQVAMPDPRAINPAVPESVVAVIRRMTEKERARRYQDPQELLADLETARNADESVSEAILGDLDDSPGTSRKRKTTRPSVAAADDDTEPGRPQTRRVKPGAESSGAGWKPPRQDDDQSEEKPRAEVARAVIFYSIAGLLVCGAIGGLGWLVMNFGSADVPPSSQGGGNPFANAPGGQTTNVVGGGLTPPVAGQTAPGAAGGQNQPRDTVIVGSALAPQSPVKPGGDSTAVQPREPAGSGPAAGNSAESAAALEQRRKREDAILPTWLTAAVSPPELPRLVVHRGMTAGGKYPSLNAALQQVPPTGALILLEGRGPFPLTPVKIAGRQRILIQSDDTQPAGGDPPVVALAPAADGAPADYFDLADTALEFQRVHIALAAAAGDSGRSLFHLRGGDLSFRNCSITVAGQNVPTMTAIRLAPAAVRSPGRASGDARVLLDQTVIRGDNLTAVLVDAQKLELVVRRSILWSGQAPVLQFAGAANDSTEKRTVRLVSATLGSTACAIQIAGDAAKPVPTAFEWVDSIATAPFSAVDPALCRLAGWTAAQQQDVFGASITWKSVDSLYLGWKSLISLDSEKTAADLADWLRVWKNRSAGALNQFQEAVWPSLPPGGIIAAGLDRFAPQTVGERYVKTAEGGWPGCAPAMLAMTALPVFDGSAGGAERPPLPEGFGEIPAPTETIRIDVNKEDLGKALANRTLQNGAQIIAAGFGARQTSPIVIQKVAVYLTFEQTEGPPLVLTPRLPDTGRSSDPSQKHDSLIVVNEGGLDITGGAFTVSASEKAPIPRWFMQVVDGDLALHNCRIQGPLLGNTRLRGLIRWSRADGPPAARLFPDSFEACAAIDGCYLVGAGPLIDADLRQRVLFIRDSVLVARDELLSVNLKGEESQIGGALDIETSTFSSGGSILDMTAAPLPAPTISPLAIFVDRCVYAPPLSTGARKVSPTLMTWTGPLLDQRQVAWWENRCGYASDISCFLRDKSLAVESQDFAQHWTGVWGGARVVDPLTGPNGVVLNKNLPERNDDRAKLEPSDFTLHSTSKAATWDGGERPIGAPLSTLKVPPIRGTSAPASTPANKPRPTRQPPRTRPSF